LSKNGPEGKRFSFGIDDSKKYHQTQTSGLQGAAVPTGCVEFVCRVAQQEIQSSEEEIARKEESIQRQYTSRPDEVPINIQRFSSARREIASREKSTQG